MGKNIKQLATRNVLALSDLFYVVANDTDYVTNLEAVKTLLGVEDTVWNTEQLSYNSTNYITTEEDSSVKGVIKISYIAKRTGYNHRSGVLTIMYDGSQVTYNDYWDVVNSDNGDLGITELSAQLSGGNYQLKISVDAGNTNDVTFNWKVIEKKPLNV